MLPVAVAAVAGIVLLGAAAALARRLVFAAEPVLGTVRDFTRLQFELIRATLQRMKCIKRVKRKEIELTFFRGAAC